MKNDIRFIEQFKKIGDEYRNPGDDENAKVPQFNSTTKLFEYVPQIYVTSMSKEGVGSNRLKLTLSNGTYVYVTLGALAWLDETTPTEGGAVIKSVFGRDTEAITAQTGDYTAAQVTNAFSKIADTLDHINEGATNKAFTSTYKSNVDQNTLYRHSHDNYDQLALITDAGGGVIPTSEQIAAWEGYLGVTTETVQDIVAAFLQNATGIAWTYDDENGTLTPTITIDGFTTDNLPEGTVNKYYTTAEKGSYVITLTAQSSVAARVSAASEGTDYPTGWTLAATDSVNLSITHTTGKTITNVVVWEEYGDGFRLSRPFNEAYSGIVVFDETITIEGLNPAVLALRIELQFR